MPRSGTTLIEQIISTHNKVTGLGETSYLEQIINKKFNLLDKDLCNKIKSHFNKNKDELVYTKKRLIFWTQGIQIRALRILDL